jgi:hypothetical protein
MSAANPNPMEESMVSVLVVANAGGGSPLLCGVCNCLLLSLAGRVANGIQDIFDVILYDWELHRHLDLIWFD